MISARPPEIRSTVANSSNTRTGSSELRTVTALVSRMRSVCAAIAASATAGAETAKSGRWCSPTPNTSSPSSSASLASSSRFFRRCCRRDRPDVGEGDQAELHRLSVRVSGRRTRSRSRRGRPARRQLVDHERVRGNERHEQQLGDAVARMRLEPGVAEIDQHDADLAAVVRVDQPGAVDHGEPVAGGQARAGDDEPGDARRERDGHARRHRRMLARPQREALRAAQVVRRVAGPCAGGRLGGRMQELHLELVERDVESHRANVQADPAENAGRSRILGQLFGFSSLRRARWAT